MNEKEQKETKAEEERIRENGQVTLEENGKRIHLLSIIGEIEGHDNLSGSTKTTKYEHILPELAKVESDEKIGGVLILVNTIGGDVSCGLALAEMIASLSKPTVSLVIGDSHSIGVPLAVASDYSFIVPTGTMLVHPVRMSGTVIGASQTYEYFEMIQDRILSFVSEHSRISYDGLKALMHNTGPDLKFCFFPCRYCLRPVKGFNAQYKNADKGSRDRTCRKRGGGVRTDRRRRRNQGRHRKAECADKKRLTENMFDL